jgi:putative tryptophan/tyrosine transport system substrate-binding protein
MKKRIIGFALSALLFGLCASAEAQQPGKAPRIAFIAGTGPEGPNVESFRRGLREFGYIEGKNIVVEYRYLGGQVDQISSVVAELLQLKVDILVSPVVPVIHAAKQATKTTPIVMAILEDPVANGFVDSLARPGGNITGLTLITRELSGKRLELFKEIIPTISRVGVLSVVGSTSSANALKEYENAARAQKLVFQPLEVRRPNPDLDAAFRAAVKGRVNAIITVRSALITSNRHQIANLAIKNRLPSMSEGIEFVEAGGLVSYATNSAESFRRAAYYVDRILKGAKPADLPVEQPMKFEFVINLKTAKQIGVTIPPNVLARADKVIR